MQKKKHDEATVDGVMMYPVLKNAIDKRECGYLIAKAGRAIYMHTMYT